MKPLTGAEIRQSFIDFFVKHGHTFVPSASVVPGGDSTLLFTNAGMVQFKDVFLGTDNRPYTRAANSQKCVRVAGKHNDLDDVGRDDTHHTFFEMLGNWSFGDYYKKEAITWAWELLTVEWGIPREKLWATYFVDDKGDVAMDDEARDEWMRQPGMLTEHVISGGRKDNFWEMADTGPCGPCSEIHIDQGEAACDKKNVPGHVCEVNGDCKRYLELWNLVFIQYNRLSPTKLEPLPAKHVDTGMGMERVVSVLQNVTSNYRTDLLFPLLKITQQITRHTDEELEANITPYRVIADHVRTSSFLIADGVVPGNTGRNYVCRMIIRRAARFGGKIGLHEPFMAKVAEGVIKIYGDAYPEVKKNKQVIFDTLTREEKRFHRTLETGIGQLEDFVTEMESKGEKTLSGEKAFELYATHGLPLELSRDVLVEKGYDVDQAGFQAAMKEHQLASGAGKGMGELGGEDVEIYREVLEDLQSTGKLPASGVKYDPYTRLEIQGNVLAILKDGNTVKNLEEGEEAEIILPETCLYIESGGQVSDTGWIESPLGIFEVIRLRKPATGVIVHEGKVVKGSISVNENASLRVDSKRRQNIRRNHTATHLLHAWLHKILGPHAVQAGSLVAPDKLRFDFNHNEAVTSAQLDEIEAGVNADIMQNYNLTVKEKTLQEALSDGATALFGEKYGQKVRTISIGDDERISYELCGGTHVDETGDIGLFIITSEGSAAAGVRRIEAVTGRAAYEIVRHQRSLLKHASSVLSTAVEELPAKAETVVKELESSRKIINSLRQQTARIEFERTLTGVKEINGIAVLGSVIDKVDADTLRGLTDLFRERYPTGVVILGSALDDRPVIICAVSDNLLAKRFHAGEFVKEAAQVVGGSGGGRPNMAQAGGKDASKLERAISQAVKMIQEKAKAI